MNNADTHADIAWMLLSTAQVLLMTPALAFFYGGLVRSKNALNTMMMSFVALGPVESAGSEDKYAGGVEILPVLVEDRLFWSGCGPLWR